MNNYQATQNRLGGGCRWLRANMSRSLQAITLTAAIVAGGVWFAATPGSNSLTLDRQDQAADTAYRAQARGQQLAASHEAVREAFAVTLPRTNGKLPRRDDHSMTRAANGGGSAGENAGTNPDEAVAAPTEIPHRPGERVIEGENGAFVTDGEPGSQQEQVDRYEREVNAGRPETENQAMVARLLDLWAPRYSDAKVAHKLLDNSVAQAMAYSEAYFASQQERIESLDLWAPHYADAKAAHQLLDNSVAQAKAYSDAYFISQQERIESLDPNARNYDRLEGRMSELLDIQLSKYLQWRTQADATLGQSADMLTEMGNVNHALRFAEDAADYDAMVSDVIEMDAVMQDLAADLTGFEDSTLALMDIMHNPDPPAAHRAGGNR